MSSPTLNATLAEISRRAAAADPAHDFSHSERVLRNALAIAQSEGGDPEVLFAAAYLHDVANLPKNHPESHLSSERSSARAEEILAEIGFPPEKLEAVKDAILCHSFSRGLTPKTRDGRIFQDADRLDAIGAIGVARAFTVGGATGRKLYADQDPFTHEGRVPNDRDNTIDHFYVKLLKLGEKMQTATGKRMAEERLARMRNFLQGLESELYSSIE